MDKIKAVYDFVTGIPAWVKAHPVEGAIILCVIFVGLIGFLKGCSDIIHAG